jgi:hypothetical protein
MVVPKDALGFLEWGLPVLQEYVEDRYPAMIRDGAVCAVYALD